MITPVILVGGSGTRLWPLSRKSFPKQFAAVLDGPSLFQRSAARLAAPGFNAPLVITGSDYRFVIGEQLLAMGIDPGSILIEPEPRNTAPAILAAALYLAQKDKDAMMLVTPSDHIIPDPDAFRVAVSKGVPEAKRGEIVTFGIKPVYPETGYGWLELDSAALEGIPVHIKRFVEKPDRAAAEAMLAAGNFLWNAGIFLFKASTIISSFEKFAPQMIEPVERAVKEAKADLGFLRLDPAAFSASPSISIDYAIMEKASNLTAIPYGAGWSDLGGWDMVANEMSADAAGNSLKGDVTAIDCTHALLRSENDNLAVVGIGLNNLIVVAMNDAVLVADRSRAQDVKVAVDALKAKGAKQADHFPSDHRPWGWFETLAIGGRFQVKRIVVNPGAALSLQSHMHRSEHWIVVSGTAKVTVDGDTKLLTENQSVYVPLGAVHRMENPGKVPMILIEVQTGAYVGEDDIIRYEDVYARGQGAKG